MSSTYRLDGSGLSSQDWMHLCLENGNLSFSSRLLITHLIAAYDLINFSDSVSKKAVHNVSVEFEFATSCAMIENAAADSTKITHTQTQTNTFVVHDMKYLHRHRFDSSFRFFLAIETSATSCSSCSSVQSLAALTHSLTNALIISKRRFYYVTHLSSNHPHSVAYQCKLKTVYAKISISKHRRNRWVRARLLLLMLDRQPAHTHPFRRSCVSVQCTTATAANAARL